MNRPKSLRIFDLEITVKEVPRSDPDLVDAFGCWDGANQIIKIAQDLSPQVYRQTLLHEALHPTFEALGIHANDPDAEEAMVCLMTTAILMLLGNDGIAEVLTGKSQPSSP